MKYSEQTIREIRDLMDEFGKVSTPEGTWEPVQAAFAAMAQNGAEDQRSVAGSMRQSLANMSSFQSAAKTWVGKLDNILDGTDPYPEGTERELDQFLEQIRTPLSPLSKAVSLCF